MPQWILIAIVVAYVAGIIACRTALHALVPQDPEYIDNELLDTLKTASSILWLPFALIYAAYLVIRLAKGVMSRLAPKKA
ncbi:hypothetical protein KJ969_04945 [Patescibacteria group bacterium]|nr:hypothetical protein [Patescibacteria group bacterium]MBU1921884.1 hypothetical protein [Patescibacteria group bacterium]